MCQYMKIWMIMLLAISFSASAKAQEKGDSTSPAVQLSLGEVWDKAEAYNKQIQMQQMSVDASKEEIKDAKAERLPDITATAEFARVTNMPLYEHGLFKAPTQFHVLHNYYRVGGDAYFNIYNGKKTATNIAVSETANQIAVEQKKLTTSEIKLRA